MRVELVDPRDVEWEIDDPAYRVHLWADGACAEYQLCGSGLSADDVLAWAEERRARSGADRAEVFVLIDHAGSRGAVRLTRTR